MHGRTVAAALLVWVIARHGAGVPKRRGGRTLSPRASRKPGPLVTLRHLVPGRQDERPKRPRTAHQVLQLWIVMFMVRGLAAGSGGFGPKSWLFLPVPTPGR
jgi:hypothetical protein